MAVTEEARVSVALVRYIDGLMGREFGYGGLDCVQLVRGWLPDRLAGLPDYTGADWRRKIAANGWRKWHLHASDYLAVREGRPRVGDIVWAHNGEHLPMFGIAADRERGYFLAETGKGRSPAVLLPFERAPVWAGRLP